MNNTVIGIDLGTSTTEAAVIRDGKPVMVVNLEGQLITPSVIGLDEEGNFIVGERARAQYLLAPKRTSIEVKRKMGTSEKIALGNRSYTPIELSGKLLDYVKTYVSEELKEEVQRAVISVPAYFDDIQRQATVQAGRLAGLQVERIINEPTAAALSYGLEHMEEESNILVYDLGGGTFDVTLLEMFDGVLEVKASSGDNKLGGKDFDEKLIQYLKDVFYKKYRLELDKDPYAVVRLKEEAENCKKALSTGESYHVLLPMLMEKGGKIYELDEVITRAQFEEMAQELLDRTHAPMEVVMSDAGILPEDIDRVILVGGSTRMPMVAKDIEDYLGIEPEKAVDPDFAVAQGAAIQAGIIEGSIRQEDSILMTDVNPYTLGIRCMDFFTDDNMSVIIPRNVTIPTSRDEIYTTSWDGQRAADIEIYQGESAIATSNHFLGRFRVDGIPQNKAGEENIKVEFSYNLNGMLEVKASIVSTGEKAGITINMMDDQEEVDISKWKESAYAKQFRTVIRRSEKELKTAEKAGDYLFQEELAESLDSLKRALVKEDLTLAEKIEKEILKLLEME